MDYLKLFEILGTVGLTLLAIYVKDIVSKATTKQKVESLERDFKDHKGELSEINKTLGLTNQSLSALNATVKGLSLWLERVDERQHNQARK